MTKYLGAAALLVALAAGPALAGPEVDACGAVAATRYDPGYKATGLEPKQINEQAAIPLCEAALAAEPESLSAKVWLARALVEAARKDEAMPLLEEAAAAGSAVGTTLLAINLLDGSAADFERAVALLKAGYENGEQFATLRYGRVLVGEVETPGKDIEAGRAILVRLAEGGDPEAANALGRYYFYGWGGEPDLPELFVWFEKAGNLGSMAGMRNVGLSYSYGEGVEQDYLLARSFLEAAAAGGGSDAINDLGIMFEYGQGVTSDLFKAQELYLQAAELGDDYGLLNRGRGLVQGRGVERDLDAAVPLFEAALARGNIDANSDLGLAYLYGEGAPKDVEKAIAYFKAGVELGSTDTMMSYGAELTDGTYLPQDTALGFELTAAAAEAGNSGAMNNLAWDYMRGFGTEIDWDQALVWVNKAIEAGDSHAPGNLGELYERGVAGLPQDIEKAKEYYQQSADLGDEWSVEQLERIARGEPPEAVE